MTNTNCSRLKDDAQQEASEDRMTLEQVESHAHICEKLAEEHKDDVLVCVALTDAAAIIRALLAERDALREALKDADNEMDWLDEDMDTCDHSVGVCMCSYWSMRRKMKAALTKENNND